MRKTVDIVGIASIVSFLLGWVSAGIWSGAGEKQPKPRTETQNVAVQTVKVLVAKSDLPQYKALRDNPGELFVEKECALGDLPKDALDFICADDVLEQQSLPKGMRAVGIQLDIDVPDGCYGPGSRVDIIWVGNAEGTSKLVAKVLLQNVIVLEASCAGMFQGDSTKRGPCIITVAVTPDDQMRLILAMEAGRFTVIRHEDNAATPPAKTGKD
ncbi:MAG TPA: RcpC/CpaB family pilus assembly protein [Gemmataceae bacterium]|nr:RcpC/CpaB family pilus assembly protein [Gemmataceae bacterium]